MNTPVAKFGSSCTVSDKFIEKIAKMGVMDAACAIHDIKEHKAAKKSDGVKTKNIRGIPKLMDANWAGTDKSGLCSIIFCEGDSAKAGIVSGLSSEDRNTIGVYPLKGKVMNTKGETAKRVSENKEITEIKQILGLEIGKKYLTIEDVASSLRYGKVLFLTDQDADGSHIKGLCVNLFQTEWSSLIRIPGFIGFMNTPILKARRGTNELMFYNDGEYNAWKDANHNGDGWKLKYYKGLGTSTGKEFKEYFENKKIVRFAYSETSDDAIDMVFNKKRADDRKDWLSKYDRTSFVDTSKSDITFEEFIHQELIHFSKYDCDRSIPNLMDGLKISLRKILYCVFKKNLTTEMKVAQLTGYVSEHSCYHHGEASLNQAIVGMAQNFVGSNNINLLVPAGQFGTRMQGGKDSASERYIFTQLTTITRMLFPVADDAILSYLSDDGYMVEPTFYAPIIPMVLVNGSKGIGTGFSTDIMCYHPLDIITYIKNKLRDIPTDDIRFIPFYEGFTGTVVPITETKYLFRGRYERVAADKVRVTELPVGFWTQDFKEMLEEMTESTLDKTGKKVPPVIRDYDDMSKDTTIDFTITFPKDRLNELESSVGEHGINGLEKLLKLCSTSSTTNMHLFNHQDKLKKYACVPEIIDDYFAVRLDLYGVRKLHLMDVLERELMVLSNKARYIQEILNDTIDLRRKKKEQVIEILMEKQFNTIDDDKDYKYLTKMSMDSVTDENVQKMMDERDKKERELDIVKSKPISVMWEEELVVLETEYMRYREDRRQSTLDKKKTKSKK
jgi:DNA topoisomerase-2